MDETNQARLDLSVSFTKHFIRVELYISDNKELFHKLEAEKANIEKELGLNLTWDELPKAKASSIWIKDNIPLLKNREEWNACFGWYAGIVKKFKDVFPKYFQGINLILVTDCLQSFIILAM